MKKLSILITFLTLGCFNCIPPASDSSGGTEPNIRTQPGIEYCGKMCDKFKELNCVGYYEDITIDCAKDPVYTKTMNCNDAGKVILSCENMCIYEMKNSVQLSPKCLADNLLACSEIETLCN